MEEFHSFWMFQVLLIEIQSKGRDGK